MKTTRKIKKRERSKGNRISLAMLSTRNKVRKEVWKERKEGKNKRRVGKKTETSREVRLAVKNEKKKKNSRTTRSRERFW